MMATERRTLIDDYLDYLANVRKLGHSTLKQYRSILKEFQIFMPVTEENFQRYRERISHNALSTQAMKLSVVTRFLDWLTEQGKLKVENGFGAK